MKARGPSVKGMGYRLGLANPSVEFVVELHLWPGIALSPLSIYFFFSYRQFWLPTFELLSWSYENLLSCQPHL